MLDPVTALFMATLMSLLIGAILGFVHRDLPEGLRPSAVDWRIGTLLIAGGSVFLAVQKYGPPALLLPLGNTMLMVGTTGYWRALRRFYGLPSSWPMLVPSVVAAAAIYWFTVQTPNLTVRVVIVSFAWAILLVGCARSFRSAPPSERSAVSRRVLSYVFAFLAVFMVFRAGYFALSSVAPGSVVDRGHWMNVVTPLLVAVLPVVGTTAFLLMCSDRIRRQWERAASTDYLTGLANRLTLGTEGDRRLEQARAHGDRLAVAVVDVDHFKSINDRFGHDVGDLALKHVAAQLQAACRGKDLPARQGGEEFVIVFDRIEPSQAKSAGERMRIAVEKAPFVANGTPLNVTVSIGVAALAPGDAAFDDLIRRADQALYAAKSNGRNRVELAE